MNYTVFLSVLGNFVPLAKRNELKWNEIKTTKDKVKSRSILWPAGCWREHRNSLKLRRMRIWLKTREGGAEEEREREREGASDPSKLPLNVQNFARRVSSVAPVKPKGGSLFQQGGRQWGSPRWVWQGAWWRKIRLKRGWGCWQHPRPSREQGEFFIKMYDKFKKPCGEHQQNEFGRQKEKKISQKTVGWTRRPIWGKRIRAKG